MVKTDCVGVLLEEERSNNSALMSQQRTHIGFQGFDGKSFQLHPTLCWGPHQAMENLKIGLSPMGNHPKASLPLLIKPIVL